METPHSIFETVLRVRPDDIDMHQHVHNSRYLDYVLAARVDQMERCYGMAMERFFESGCSWFVKTAHIEHRRALRLGDSARVRTSISEIRKREVRVVFEILRLADGRVSAEGYCEYTLVDLGNGRPKSIPEEVILKYSV
ncbi:MAG TPA: thioesterase family protein [Verrucomicrobiales bacterium]|nr:thioesterase family protein [Verrucomicrobiales bacterium]